MNSQRILQEAVYDLRERNVMNAVLPWQWEHSCSAFQEPVTFFRLRVATVSLCVPGGTTAIKNKPANRVPSDQ